MGIELALDEQERGEQEWALAGMQGQQPGMQAQQVEQEMPESCEEEELG